MSTDILCKVADYFNTSVDYILCNTNEETPHNLIERKNKNRLKELRKENNISQDKISKVLFMSQNGYSNYETGRLDLPYNVLLKLSNYYNTSIDYILCRTDDFTPYLKNKNQNS